MQYCPHGEYKYNTVPLEPNISISGLQILNVKILPNTKGEILLCNPFSYFFWIEDNLGPRISRKSWD